MPEGGCKKWDITLKNRIAHVCSLTMCLDVDIFCSCHATFRKITLQSIHELWLFLDRHLDHVERNNENSEILDNILNYDKHSVDNFYYAMKANNNLEVLKTIDSSNFGFECVSIEEVKYIRKHFPDAKIIFTPNYCDINEYASWTTHV